MTTSLLPRNSTQLERDLELLLAHSTDLPVAIKSLWDPYDCPASLLPWLAWANSVDDWQESWPEKVKRQVIADAFDVHRYKGTPHAVQTALDSLGVESSVIEWWEPTGSQQPGTMTVTAVLNDNITTSGEGVINAQMLRLITRAINNAKRGSIHYDLELGIYFSEGFALAAARARAVGINATAPHGSAVLPDPIKLEPILSAGTCRLEQRAHEAVAGAVTPGSVADTVFYIAGIHQTLLSNIELQGVS